MITVILLVRRVLNILILPHREHVQIVRQELIQKMIIRIKFVRTVMPQKDFQQGLSVHHSEHIIILLILREQGKMHVILPVMLVMLTFLMEKEKTIQEILWVLIQVIKLQTQVYQQVVEKDEKEVLVPIHFLVRVLLLEKSE